MASRPTKLMICRSNCAGQSGEMHRISAVSFSRTVFAPQTGQVSGIWNRCQSAGRFSLRTSLIFGMISPDLYTTMVSPIPTSRVLIKSWLCKVARETLVPHRRIGSKMAVGVIRPVLPTDNSISSSFVSFSSGGYLYAIAQRGTLEVAPSF